MKQYAPKADKRSGRRRFGRAQDPHIDDPYKAQKKPQEPSVCTECGAVFHKGRWCWMKHPVEAATVICQACHRINDHFPAGEVTLKGAFVLSHRQELLAAARHNEELENKDHPLNRIMGIEEADDRIVVTTTDIHLPRRIGEAIHRAYHGKLDYHYDPGSYSIRVTWARED